MGSVLVGLFPAGFPCMARRVWIGSIGMQITTYGMICTGIDGSIETIMTGVVIAAIMAYTSNQAAITAFIKEIIMKRPEKNATR